MLDPRSCHLLYLLALLTRCSEVASGVLYFCNMRSKQRIIFMYGPPASGKSTWAINKVQSEPGWVRVNRDTIREMFALKPGKRTESLCRKARDSMIITAIGNGYNVIVDDTNGALAKNMRIVRDALQDWATSCTGRESIDDFIDFEVQDMNTVSMEECIERDSKRDKKVGPLVIKRMFKEHFNATNV